MVKLHGERVVLPRAQEWEPQLPWAVLSVRRSRVPGSRIWAALSGAPEICGDMLAGKEVYTLEAFQKSDRERERRLWEDPIGRSGPGRHD